MPVPAHCGTLAAVSRFFFSNSKKNLPIFLTDCVSLQKKLRLFRINIERVIKCFVLFRDILFTFFFVSRTNGQSRTKK